ncbi:hypothetical protein BC833DRAFT_603761 [Globomyces pollinis-pini]|nr:hypothetical protein BC833DRAFT_603761 [Globomyces pollinis-pini]
MNRTFLILLVSGMLFTGTINTLLNKLQDLTCVDHCDGPNKRYFEQPLFQTINMFVGEIMCLFVFLIMDWNEKRQGDSTYHPIPEGSPSNELPEHIESSADIPAASPKPLTGVAQLLFLLPTLCDLTGTTLMNIGLIFTSASIYQMLRGSVVLFTGLFSTIFLGRKHPLYRWFALCVVFLGVAIVGLSPLVSGAEKPVEHATPTSPIGIFLVVLAQCFTASQFVIEEKIMVRYQVAPLKAVGLEGLFGLTLSLIAVPILHFTLGVRGEPGNVFNFDEMVRQISHPQVLYAGIGIMFSISIFNYCGLAVTKNISATSRSTIDTCRTLFIWMASLALHWETFKWLQVVGFVVLIYGTFIFNDVIQPPSFVQSSLRLEDDHTD